MSRNFFTLENGAITTPLGEIKSLGIHCPQCKGYVGSKTTCPECSEEKRMDIWHKEPIHDVLTNTGGFPFKLEFVPFQTSDKFGKILKDVKEFIDDRGERYNLEGIKKLLNDCEVPNGYKEILDEEVATITDVVSNSIEFDGDGRSDNNL